MDNYDLSRVLDVEPLSAVRPGSSILLSGPAMTGKQGILLGLLADGLRQDEGAMAVTTSDRAADVAADLERRVPEFDGRAAGVMDCRAEGSRDEETLPSGVHAHHISSPSDLTAFGITITETMDRLGTAGYDRGRLGLASLSTMLTYADDKSVFKFCHVLSSRLDGAEFVGVFTIDSTAHDDRTLQVLKQAFDSLVEVREQDGQRQARVRGPRTEPTDWHRI
jgi:KaiC/GvpD/RAD55 family RecA-like ATPase